MSQPVHNGFIRSFDADSARLAIRTFVQKYGDLDQDTLLQNIHASDTRFTTTSPYSDVTRTIAAQGDEYRTWFLCNEWLEKGVYTENTCVFYQRKNQDGEQALSVCTDVAKQFNAELFGYPPEEPSKYFILYPASGNKDILETMKYEINRKLHQWSYLPAIMSDIRVWPLRINLLNPGQNESHDCLPFNCQ